MTPNRTEIRALMEHYGVKPSKALGQNFLADGNIISKIVDLLDLREGDTVLEIGPGFGALTFEIAARLGAVSDSFAPAAGPDHASGGHIIAVEKDSRLAAVLEGAFAQASAVGGADGASGTGARVNVVSADFLDYDLSALPAGYKIAGNLPYSITTPAIMKAVEAAGTAAPAAMVFMVQKEVAERLCAPPGGRDYGAISVAVQYRCRAEIAMTVSREVFIPKPHVDSAVLVLTPEPGRCGTPKDEALFLSVVKAGFGQRRKMLRNALSNLLPDAETLAASFARAGIEGTARAETLPVRAFIALADAIYDILNVR
jgi:16S rRNA (adenine1518-N6/adenine1519-N6)-dimethyltransferase